jgi:BirA family transcriptional regulator, biotin operon repressor / biotin---[acetyl-CoA-carboxylase] ligase
MTLAYARLDAYDDVAGPTLCAESGASQLVIVAECSSTMDLAHELAADGAEHGSVVVAEAQGAGRGRSGKTWRSERGAGVWVSVLLRRPADAPAGVLSIRVGLELADALDARVAEPMQLKWPNDLFLGRKKLAGVLTEARWRGTLLEWIVVGVGINLRLSDVEAMSAALPASVRASQVLVDVVHAVLRAGARRGDMSPDEMAAFARRDIAVGRHVVEPLGGVVRGITSTGGIVIQTATGDAVAVSGSLVFRSPLTE